MSFHEDVVLLHAARTYIVVWSKARLKETRGNDPASRVLVVTAVYRGLQCKSNNPQRLKILQRRRGCRENKRRQDETSRPEWIRQTANGTHPRRYCISTGSLGKAAECRRGVMLLDGPWIIDLIILHARRRQRNT